MSVMNQQFTIHKDLTTMFGFMTLVGPFFVMFMLVSLSIFNSNFKGFVYLAGASLLYVLVRLLNDSNSQVGEAHPLYCNLFGSTLGFSVPSFNSALYVFTLTYLLIPMISYNMFNIPLVLFFIFLFALDTITRTTYVGCTTSKGVLLGTLLGGVWGVVYYLLLSQNDNTKSFLYYNDFESSRTACMKPTKQNFKCNVYKNGELIESI